MENKKVFKTGNEIVDRVEELMSKLEADDRIPVLYIPPTWCQSICKENGEMCGEAVTILADIVREYQTSEMQNGGRYLLKTSYQHFADMYNFDKGDITNALVALEKLGVVTPVFRKVEISERATPDELLLALDLEVLKRLMYPKGDAKFLRTFGECGDI